MSPVGLELCGWREYSVTKAQRVLPAKRWKEVLLMPYYCSRDVFEALEGISFPATKDDLIEYAEMNDASEAVIVSLDQLDDHGIYRDISEVCDNARVQCGIDVMQVLESAPFPATREELLRFAQRHGADGSVMFALSALPSGFTFTSSEEMCGLIL